MPGSKAAYTLVQPLASPAMATSLAPREGSPKEDQHSGVVLKSPDSELKMLHTPSKRGPGLQGHLCPLLPPEKGTDVQGSAGAHSELTPIDTQRLRCCSRAMGI